MASYIAFVQRFILVFAALTFLAIATEGMAQMSMPSADKSGTKAPPAAREAMPGMGTTGGMHESMTGMMKNMESMKTTGDTDRDFAMLMKVHHQGAIDMAEVELKNGKDPTMRALAKRIIEAQRKEIKEIDQWLGKHK